MTGNRFSRCRCARDGRWRSDFFYSLDSNDIDLDDDMLHGVQAGLTGGLQLKLFSLITLDVKYHHAFHPIIKTRPESKLRGWTLAAGIKF